MNIGEASIEAMNRPVIRVRIQTFGRARYKYFSSVQSAARYLAWNTIYSSHRVFDNSYTVDDMSCECDRGGHDSDGCELHDHDTGFYVTEMRRIKAEILAAWESTGEGASSLDDVLREIGDV